MRLWKLNLGFIKKKKVSFILSTLMLIISLVAINYMTSFIESNLSTFRIISNLDAKHYVYFQHQDPALRQLILDEEIDSTDNYSYDTLVEQTLSKLKVPYEIGTVSYNGGWITLENGMEDYFAIKQMSSELENTLHLPLSSGRWCQTTQDGIIEAVISNQSHNYHVGDIVLMECSDQIYQVRISGILDHSQLEFMLSVGGDVLCSLDFLFPFDEIERDSTLAYFPSSVSFPESILEQGRILFFNENVSQQQMEDAISMLSDYGYVTTKDELRSGTMAQIRVCLSRYLPTAILLILIVIMGLTSSTILTLLEYRKHFAVFFIVGCTWMQCTIVNLMYVCTSVVISVIGFFIYQIAFATDYFSLYNLAITVVICIFVIAISAVIPYQNMRKMSPKELIVLENE